MKPLRSIVALSALALALALAWAGCTSSNRGMRPVPPADGGGGAVDAASEGDSGSALDSGAASDAAGVDAGAMDTDAGEGLDAGPGPGVDAGITPLADAGPGVDAGPPAMDAGPPRIDAGIGTGAPTVAGQLVITELMANPMLLADTVGEWLELYNPSATATYDLAGCVLSDIGTDAHTIGASLTIGPRAYVTLARTATPGFTPTYVYSTFNIANTADEAVLTCGGVVIDQVLWDTALGWTIPDGASIQLSPSSLDAVSNDAPTSWCPATTAFGSGDRGTPGAPNGC